MRPPSVGASDWIELPSAGALKPVIPILGRLFIGRECAGVSDSQRLVLDDPQVSRDHLWIRVDPSCGAVLTDHSANGTRVNGRRVERDEPLRLHDGDTIELGGVTLRFRTHAHGHRFPLHVRETLRTLAPVRLASVVGDVVGYTALVERHGAATIAEVIDPLFGALRELLVAHGGTVASVAGDSIFAAWDATDTNHGAERAVAFAVAASELVAERPTGRLLRDTRTPVLRMGWGVTLGDVVEARTYPASESVHGAALNLAFRLSGIAARDGRPCVLVSSTVAAAAPAAAAYGEPVEVSVRGRVAPATVVAATASR